MKALFLILILILCVIGIAYLMHVDPGYILIAYHHYTVETTLWFGVVALVIVLIVLKIIFGVLTGIISFPALFKLKQKKKHLHKAQQLLQQGLLDLVGGDFQSAIQSLQKGGKYSNDAIVNDLAVAYALHQVQKLDESNAALEKALQDYPQHKSTIQLLQAQLLLDGQCYKKAETVLEDITDKQAKTAVYYELLVQCYCGLQQWSAAEQAFSSLKRCKYLNEQKLNGLAQTITIGNLTACAIDELEKYWSSLDKKEKQNEAYLWLVADRFIENEMYKKAFELLKSAIKQDSSEELWEMLVLCVPSEAEAILHFSQKCLKHHKDQWYVFYCAAMAAYECGDIQLAQQYLLDANQLQQTDEALLLLADIYNQQGDSEQLHQTCLALLNQPKED